MSKCARVSSVVVGSVVTSNLEGVEVKSLNTEGSWKVFVKVSEQDLVSNVVNNVSSRVK